MNFRKMFEDQVAFNRLIFDRNAADERSMIERFRNLTLGMIEESLEFIRTFDYKVHRRSKLRLQNVAHSHEELIDLFKYWLSMCDLADFPFERLEELYFAKSRVVQYRYQEEWVKTITGPSVVVDIDMVLGDYITAICKWAREYGPGLMQLSNVEMVRVMSSLAEIQLRSKWIDEEAVGVTHMQWQRIKHNFRTCGGKRTLPVFPDAKPFLEWCRAQGWTIILVTSRPVDEYPNIFTDTLSWLHDHQLPFDHVWWATEKAERLEEANIVLRSQIVFAVDDSERFVGQFRSKGVPAYLLDRKLPFDDSDPTRDPFRVRSLHDLMTRHARMQEAQPDKPATQVYR